MEIDSPAAHQALDGLRDGNHAAADGGEAERLPHCRGRVSRRWSACHARCRVRPSSWCRLHGRDADQMEPAPVVEPPTSVESAANISRVLSAVALDVTHRWPPFSPRWKPFNVIWRLVGRVVAHALNSVNTSVPHDTRKSMAKAESLSIAIVTYLDDCTCHAGGMVVLALHVLVLRGLYIKQRRPAPTTFFFSDITAVTLATPSNPKPSFLLRNGLLIEGIGSVSFASTTIGLVSQSSNKTNVGSTCTRV
ncbi:hypothetical protein EJB05_21892, partial [Eragrostis curvula]